MRDPARIETASLVGYALPSSPLQSRSWLDEKSSDTCLHIWDTERTRISRTEHLDLCVIFPDGTSLLEPINAEWLRLVRSYVYLLRDDATLCINAAKTHVAVVHRLITFLKWARLHGIFDLRRMTPELTEKFSSDIALGTGHALKYVDRLQRHICDANGNLPLTCDKYYPKRKVLDVDAICEATFISVQGLASDKVASQLIARVAAQRGYRAPSWQAATKGALPEPKPVTRATHARFIEAIRYLHKWNPELGGAGLSFVPLPTREGRLGSARLRQTGHKKNIPPKEAMTLLDASLRWVFHHGPRVLDIFDDVEAFYKAECHRASQLDRWVSINAVASLRDAMSRFLASEDAKGVVPHGCHKIVSAATGRGYEIARSIITGTFTSQSRAAAMGWLRPNGQVSDAELQHLVRVRLSMEQSWSTTWPYSTVALAGMIGIGTKTLTQFINGGTPEEARSLQRIEIFLVSHGMAIQFERQESAHDSKYRTDRGIEKRLAEYVKQHPLNQTSEHGGPWPLRWNLANSSRDDSISLHEALRYCIPSAARVVLGTFQARRESEQSSLTTSCVTEEAGRLWLESYIAKSLRRDRKLPTVQTITDVVALLTRWSQRGRKQNGTNLLFSYWEPLGKAISAVKPNTDLNRFAKLALPASPSKPLQIHQFRRFFAVTFIWRYRLPNLPALSDFLCHSGLQMTWEYVTERVGTTVMLEAQAEFSREMLVGAALGRIKLHGAFGRTWHRWAEVVRARVKSSIEFVSTPDQADRVFLERVEAGVRLLTPTPGGFCAARNRERDSRRAACRVPDPTVPGRYIKKPELGRAALCARCPFGATDEMHRGYWISAARDARVAADSPFPSIIRERARVDAPKLERIAAILSAKGRIQ